MVSANLIAMPQWVYYVHVFMPWVAQAGLVILLVAAFLHWLRTRHWCLLTLAIGSLLMAVGGVACQIVQCQLRPVETLASGTVKFDMSTVAALMWLVAAGEIIAAVGGIGAIHWAISLRREESN